MNACVVDAIAMQTYTEAADNATLYVKIDQKGL